jgi:hypothetical protein
MPAPYREQLAECGRNLLKIHSAFVEYRTDHDGEMPDWLSDLVPEYISTQTLRCPVDLEGRSAFAPDPRLPCSYDYQFAAMYYDSGVYAKTGMTLKELAVARMKQQGEEDVLAVRCFHHFPPYSLKLMYSGVLYRDVPDTNFLREYSPDDPPESP